MEPSDDFVVWAMRQVRPDVRPDMRSLLQQGGALEVTLSGEELKRLISIVVSEVSTDICHPDFGSIWGEDGEATLAYHRGLTDGRLQAEKIKGTGQS